MNNKIVKVQDGEGLNQIKNNRKEINLLLKQKN